MILRVYLRSSLNKLENMSRFLFLLIVVFSNIIPSFFNLFFKVIHSQFLVVRRLGKLKNRLKSDLLLIVKVKILILIVLPLF